MDKKEFYKTVTRKFGPLKQSQIDGFENIINEAIKRKLDKRWLAYALATTWHETARTMQPITEYGSQKYLRSKKYWPYIGRGYVQLTWKVNYEKYGIADTPEKALDPQVAVFILFDGMEKGVFTGKKFSDYFNDRITDWVGARRIINGTDRAKLIADYALVFYEGLRK